MNISVESFLTISQSNSILDYCKSNIVLEEGKLNQDVNLSVRKSKVGFSKLSSFEFLIGQLISPLLIFKY